MMVPIILAVGVMLAGLALIAYGLWLSVHVDLVAVPVILEGEAASQWFDEANFACSVLLSVREIPQPQPLFQMREPGGVH